MTFFIIYDANKSISLLVVMFTLVGFVVPTGILQTTQPALAQPVVDADTIIQETTDEVDQEIEQEAEQKQDQE
ncbi:MAG: hypothetical protein M3146_08320 [Thermoproteota archaeon]|nr:hypothetical protein [Thermoproteota archaeon]